MDTQEEGERLVVSLSVATATAALVVLPLYLVLTESIEWVHRESLLTLGEVIGSPRLFIPAATILLAGAVIYTVLQELIVLTGRSGRHIFSPATLVLVLAPFCVSMEFGSRYMMERGGFQFGGAYGTLLPALVLASLVASFWVGFPILLRYGMSFARGKWHLVIYAAGLSGLGLAFWAIAENYGPASPLGPFPRMFLYGATGFLAGGLGQLVAVRVHDPEPAESDRETSEGVSGQDADLADGIEQCPAEGVPFRVSDFKTSDTDTERPTEGWGVPPKKVDNYRAEAMESWRNLWVVFNAALLVEGVICLVYLGSLMGQARQVHGAAKDAMGLAPFLFAIGANIAFALGPIVDLALYTDLRIRMGRARYVLFAVGLLSAMLFVLEGTLFLRGSGFITF